MQNTAYGQVEGQLGAAAAVLSNMRGDWRVTPAVGFTREQDLVHRVRRQARHRARRRGQRRAAPARCWSTRRSGWPASSATTPVYDVTVGDGEGQVPLRGLERHLVKLPRNIKPKEVNILDRKLKAMAPGMPIPKGPMPDARARAGAPARTR